MSDYVKGGLVTDLLKSLSSFLDGAFKWLTDTDAKVEDGEDVKDDKGQVVGRMFTLITGNNTKVRAKILYSAGRRDKVDMYLLGPDGQKGSYTGVSAKDIRDKLTQFVEDKCGGSFEYLKEGADKDIDVEKEFSEDEEESVDDVINEEVEEGIKSSKHLNVTLQKITGSEEIGVIACKSNYNPILAFSDIESVIDQLEFEPSELEDGVVLDIIPDEIDLEVNESSESEITELDEAIKGIIKLQIFVLFKLYNSNIDFGTNSEKSYAISMLRYQLDEAIQIAFRNDITLNMFGLASEFPELVEELNVSTTGELVESYCVCLEFYQPNLSHEIETLLDEWILSLRYNM